jgi:DNA replication protein
VRKFKGFLPGKFRMAQVPAPFFDDLVPLVDDLAELKVLLFCVWALPQKEKQFAYLRRDDFLRHAPLVQGLETACPDAPPADTLDAALNHAVERGALLRATVNNTHLYFFNTAHGREAVEQIKAGHWIPGDRDNPVEILPERPNIYQLYENNIGSLTPMIADELKDMETEFPEQWIEDAIRIAVENNARKLRYIRAVLQRWQSEGRNESTRQTLEEDSRRFITGEWAEFIDH